MSTVMITSVAGAQGRVPGGGTEGGYRRGVQRWGSRDGGPEGGVQRWGSRRGGPEGNCSGSMGGVKSRGPLYSVDDGRGDQGATVQQLVGGGRGGRGVGQSWRLEAALLLHPQSGGNRSCRRKRSLTWGRTSSFSSTSFSRKGTSFSSSLSPLSMNQLSMGMPLDS